jgi:LPS O-antigen subunit length determinant protein (WzzB/FepE family)
MNKIGINWKYKWLLLRDANEMLEAKVKRLERKLKKYENNNTRSTRNRKNNNVVELSGRIYTGRN